MIEKMLNPGIVGIPCRRDTKFPAAIFSQKFSRPIAHIERRSRNDEIGFEVFVRIIEEGAFVVPFDLRAVDSPDREIYLGKAPDSLIAFLPVNRNVVHLSLMSGNELFRLDKHSARTTARVKDPAFLGFKYFD